MKPQSATVFATVVAVIAALAIAGPVFAAPNVINANVNHGITGQGVDQAFAHVRICVPGSTTQCQNLGGLLIDTGSFGLRIFAQALTVKLPVQMSGPDRVGECAFFGSLTAWGRVATADVTMGGEPTISSLPVQIINPNFPATGDRPKSCNGSNAPIARTPQQENFNGILGVGLLQYDGGLTQYYACTSTTCTPMSQPALADQVQNPVALLPVDNNGVLLSFSLPPATGASTLTGQLIFGINTESNNHIPDTFTVYPADPTTLSFTTTYQGRNISESFIDSGSNGFFYHNPYLALCPGSPWYCPAALSGQHATNTGFDSPNSGLVKFNIANAFGLFISGNAAFFDLGADLGGGTLFDWGLPFFFGRKVFVGIAGKSITGVTESTPLWAYK